MREDPGKLRGLDSLGPWKGKHRDLSQDLAPSSHYFSFRPSLQDVRTVNQKIQD